MPLTLEGAYTQGSKPTSRYTKLHFITTPLGDVCQSQHPGHDIINFADNSVILSVVMQNKADHGTVVAILFSDVSSPS